MEIFLQKQKECFMTFTSFKQAADQLNICYSLFSCYGNDEIMRNLCHQIPSILRERKPIPPPQTAMNENEYRSQCKSLFDDCIVRLVDEMQSSSQLALEMKQMDLQILPISQISQKMNEFIGEELKQCSLELCKGISSVQCGKWFEYERCKCEFPEPLNLLITRFMDEVFELFDRYLLLNNGNFEEIFKSNFLLILDEISTANAIKLVITMKNLIVSTLLASLESFMEEKLMDMVDKWISLYQPPSCEFVNWPWLATWSDSSPNEPSHFLLKYLHHLCFAINDTFGLCLNGALISRIIDELAMPQIEQMYSNCPLNDEKSKRQVEFDACFIKKLLNRNVKFHQHLGDCAAESELYCQQSYLFYGQLTFLMEFKAIGNPSSVIERAYMEKFTRQQRRPSRVVEKKTASVEIVTFQHERKDSAKREQERDQVNIMSGFF